MELDRCNVVMFFRCSNIFGFPKIVILAYKYVTHSIINKTENKQKQSLTARGTDQVAWLFTITEWGSVHRF